MVAGCLVDWWLSARTKTKTSLDWASSLRHGGRSLLSVKPCVCTSHFFSCVCLLLKTVSLKPTSVFPLLWQTLCSLLPQHQHRPPPTLDALIPLRGKLFSRPFHACLLVMQVQLNYDFLKETLEHAALLAVPSPEILPTVTCVSPYFIHVFAQTHLGAFLNHPSRNSMPPHCPFTLPFSELLTSCLVFPLSGSLIGRKCP